MLDAHRKFGNEVSPRVATAACTACTSSAEDHAPLRGQQWSALHDEASIPGVLLVYLHHLLLRLLLLAGRGRPVPHFAVLYVYYYHGETSDSDLGRPWDLGDLLSCHPLVYSSPQAGDGYHY